MESESLLSLQMRSIRYGQKKKILDTYRCLMLVKLANDLGMGPDMLFSSICNLFKFVR